MIMNRNIIRPAAIGVTAGVATAFTLLAWEELDPLHGLQRLIERRQLSPDERAEFDRLEAERTEQAAKRRRAHEERIAVVRTKFRAHLLTTSTATTLEELTVIELLAAIQHAQGEKCRAWNGRRVSYGQHDDTTVEMWSDQLSALRSEYDARHWGERRRAVGLIDRLRIDNAYSWVHDYDREIPPIVPDTPPTPRPPVPAVSESVYPQFDGPDSGVAEEI